MRLSSSILLWLLAIAWLHAGGITLAVQPPTSKIESSQPFLEPREEEVTVIRLRTIDAEAAQQILETLFAGQVKISTEPSSNSLVLRAEPTHLEVVTALLRELDESASRADQQQNTQVKNATTLTLKAPPSKVSVSQLREEYRLLEQQCAQLAQQLRNPNKNRKDSNSEAPKQALTELVERVFQARQQLQRAELAENARRLEKIQHTLDTREGLKSRIVERRVNELLNPNGDRLESVPKDSSKATISEKKISDPASKDDRQVTGSLALDPLLAGSSNLDLTAANSNSLVGASDLLRISPTEMRELLRRKAFPVLHLRRRLKNVRSSQQKNGEEQQQNSELQRIEGELKDVEEEFQFAKLQYDETVKYLEVAVDSLKQQLTIANQEYDRKREVYNKGNQSLSELRAASVRPRELQVELQRVESLLKLYRAAGDIPELTEVQSKTTATLGLTFNNPKLGAPKWLDGNGGLTTGPKGFWVNAKVEPGTCARILFAKIPGHDDSKLMLKIDMPNSVGEVISNQRRDGAWHVGLVVEFTDADIQTALDGKPVRKQLVLNEYSGSVVKEPADDEKVVAIVELALPSPEN